ncbi:MAG: anti-sigma F factor [Limnochordales bacterium]|nr:anti-sigma F factor [Limnochordales bacterium]
MTLPEGIANQVVLEFPSKPENVAFARTAVAVFAAQLDFTLDELDEIKVAVSEAVSNAVIHAYGDTVGTVRVEAAITTGGELILRIIDRGQGIPDVAAARQPQWTSRPEERMGLGFTFMEEYMDAVDVESAPQAGTRVTLRKAPARAPIAR